MREAGCYAVDGVGRDCFDDAAAESFFATLECELLDLRSWPTWQASTLRCRVMKVSASGFYAWRSRPFSDRDRDDAELTNVIVDIHRMSRRSYGSIV